MPKKLTTDLFIERLNEIHPEIILLNQYKNKRTPVKLLCECGLEYETNAGNVLDGKGGCPNCSHNKLNYDDAKKRLVNKIQSDTLKGMDITLFKCDTCGKEISSTLNQVYHVLENKDVYQCASCYQKEDKYCAYCRKLIMHKSNSKYCSKECYNKSLENFYNDKYNTYIERWKQGLEDGIKGKNSISRYIRRYMFEKNNSQCEKCGWHEVNPITGLSPLQIHHIDGDCHNNNEDNLQLLCPNCHSLTENFCSLNTGNSTRE